MAVSVKISALSVLLVLSMTIQNQAIFDAALALPSEHALLVKRLLGSLSPEHEEFTDDTLFGSLERQRIEVEKGLVKPIPPSEARLKQ
jgi:hypothetical protein